MSTHTFNWVVDAQPSQFCLTRTHCIPKFSEILSELFDQAPGSNTFLLEIENLNTALIDELCASCAKEAKKKHDAGRRRMWAKLPSYFGLPPWEELLRHDSK